jgi:hypothetical protein
MISESNVTKTFAIIGERRSGAKSATPRGQRNRRRNRRNERERERETTVLSLSLS